MKTTLFLLGLFAVWSGSLLAQTIYVDVDATDPTPDGSSWTEAFPALQDALASATSGNEIWVAEGTYYPDLSAGVDSDDTNATFSLIDGVSIFGGFAGNESSLMERDPNPATNGTILSGFIRPSTGAGVPDLRSENVVTATGTDNTALLDGFTITEGHATGTNRGGGLLANPGSDAILKNLIFRDNLSAFVGGAAYFNLGSPSFINVSFLDNECDGTSSSTSSVNGEGGAIYLNQANPTFINCLFTNNQAVNDGGAISNHNSTITLLNCTLIQNHSDQTGGAVYNSNTSFVPTVTNTIIWGNTATISDPSVANGAPTYSHSLIEGLNPAGSGNLDGTDLNNDPDFVSASDFRLLFGSPVIQAGDTTSYQNAGGPSTDLGGAPRIWDSDIDLGAYEFSDLVLPTITSFTLTTSDTTDATSLEFAIIFSEDISEFDSSDFIITPTGTFAYTGISLSGSGSNFTATLTGVSGEGQVSISIKTDGSVTDLSGNPVAAHLGITDILRLSTTSPTHFVNASNATPTPPYDSWANAANTVQDALAYSATGDSVWVSTGNYYPDEGQGQSNGERTSSFALQTGVALYGGFLGTELLLSERDIIAHPTILSGDLNQDDDSGGDNSENAYHVVTASNVDSSAILDGFIITSGNANGASSNAWGGGLFMTDSSSPAITNCSIIDNSASTYGGGAINFNGSAPTYTNCTFSGNTTIFGTSYGGAVSNINSNSIFKNCLFTNNSSTFGGAIYNTAFSPQFINCVIRDNDASIYGGGALDSSSAPTYTNCLFQGNSANSNGGGLYSVNTSNSTVLNCTLTQNSTTNSSGGGLFINNALLYLTNSIVWGNTDSSGAGNASSNIASSGASNNYSHSLVEMLDVTSFGTGNFDGTDPANDPLFASASDFHLLTGSPAIDAGDSSANTEPFDLAGDPRIINTAIDLGVYEGAVVTFSHLGFTNPTADDNNNGLTNYTDYALGGDPTAPNDPSLQSALIGNQLIVSFRNNAADVFVEFQKSDTLLPNDWDDMILGVDYTLSSESINGAATTQTLDLLTTDPKLFFREYFSETAP